MTFRYFKKTGEIRRPVVINGETEYEWDGDEGFEFEHDVDDKELLDAVCNLVDEYYFEGKMNIKNFKNFVRDFGLFDTLIEGFEDELHDYFEEEALESLE